MSASNSRSEEQALQALAAEYTENPVLFQRLARLLDAAPLQMASVMGMILNPTDGRGQEHQVDEILERLRELNVVFQDVSKLTFTRDFSGDRLIDRVERYWELQKTLLSNTREVRSFQSLSQKLTDLTSLTRSLHDELAELPELACPKKPALERACAAGFRIVLLGFRFLAFVLKAIVVQWNIYILPAGAFRANPTAAELTPLVPLFRTWVPNFDLWFRVATWGMFKTDPLMIVNRTVFSWKVEHTVLYLQQRLLAMLHSSVGKVVGSGPGMIVIASAITMMFATGLNHVVRRATPGICHHAEALWAGLFSLGKRADASGNSLNAGKARNNMRAALNRATTKRVNNKPR